MSQKITLPETPVLPSQFGFPDGCLAEDYYSRLRNQQPPPPQKGKGKGKGQGNGEAGEGEGSGDGELEPGIPGGQPSGSGADGVTRKWEQGKPNAADPKAPEGITEGQAELIRHEVARRVQQAAKSQGSVPAGMKRWADNVITPNIDYKREIITQVKQAIEQIRGHSNQTYSRIARKQYQGGIIAAATVKALPNQEGIKVYACDAACYPAQQCFKAEQVSLLGGGGTDLSLGIVKASEDKPRPQLVIVLTDGYTNWPSAPTNGVPCLAIIVSDGSESAPEWVRQIKVPPSSLEKGE